jgi:hypothetical protein
LNGLRKNFFLLSPSVNAMMMMKMMKTCSKQALKTGWLQKSGNGVQCVQTTPQNDGLQQNPHYLYNLVRVQQEVSASRCCGMGMLSGESKYHTQRSSTSNRCKRLLRSTGEHASFGLFMYVLRTYRCRHTPRAIVLMDE